MALRSKFLHHNRSLSLPSKPTSSHNLDAKPLEAASCSSMEASVRGLKALYVAIDDLLLLPHIQPTISQDSHHKWIHQVLDGYIVALDACSTAKDLVSAAKHRVQELLSALRRRDAAGVRRYLSATSKSKKSIQKCLRSFRSESALATLDQKAAAASDLVMKLSEAEEITVATLESLLSYLIGARVPAKQRGWAVVAKLVHSKRDHMGVCVNEFEKMDALLQTSLEGGGKVEEELMNLSKEVDSRIWNLEEELECLFRQLIRTRVLLLNILNH